MPTGARPAPKSIVLDMLRVAGRDSVAVSSLVEIAGMFGITENALRVAVTRLVASGLVEPDERGAYRLAAAADPVTSYVERWRLGEKRVRTWQGAWLVVTLPKRPERTERKRTLARLQLLGFRPALDGLHVRPDNFAEPLAETRARLDALGIEAGAESFIGDRFSEALVRRWLKELWPIRKLERSYRDATERLLRSEERVSGASGPEPALETFVVGGEAIRILATDPLLPEGVIDTAARNALGRAMRRYERIGRRLWNRLFPGLNLPLGPDHLTAVTDEIGTG